MNFRPCIDIHNGQVKQIVGGTLTDFKNHADENFVSNYDAKYFANLYKQNHLKGGHVILLNSKDSIYYESTKKQALEALRAYPKGLQVGGGITDENALDFLMEGASHVIVTSFVFSDGKINYNNLKKIVQKIGKERLVLDLSCKKTDDGYKVVTDRWQKMTEEKVTKNLLEKLSEYCDEFLIHAVDVEGKSEGIERELVELLSQFSGCKITYAGGVHNFDDLRILKEVGKEKIDVTIGSALDIFGGSMEWNRVVEFIGK